MFSGPPGVSLEALAKAIRSHCAATRVERAIVFGSFARGLVDVASDLDLRLVEPTERPFLERGLAHLPLFRLGIGVDLLVYPPQELTCVARSGNPLADRALREGIEVYARSGAGEAEGLQR